MIANRITLNPERIAAAQAVKEVFNVAEAAAFLGCSSKQLTRLVKDNAIPHRKLKRRVFFSREALRRWTAGEDFNPAKNDATTEPDSTTAGN